MTTYTIEINEAQRAAIVKALKLAPPEPQYILNAFDELVEDHDMALLAMFEDLPEASDAYNKPIVYSFVS
jgi:hypothetical protein